MSSHIHGYVVDVVQSAVHTVLFDGTVKAWVRPIGTSPRQSEAANIFKKTFFCFMIFFKSSRPTYPVVAPLKSPDRRSLIVQLSSVKYVKVYPVITCHFTV